MAIGWWRSSWGWKVWDCPALSPTIAPNAATAIVEAGFCRGINGNEYEDRFCQCAHRIAAGGRNRISARANSSYV
jgi:hypothetical protein